jgi:inosine triphosphate pyrophosphatase
MAIHFITGNKDKFTEIQTVLGAAVPLEQVEIDLPEIQSLDAHEVIKYKLLAAEKHAQGEYIVEDTSLYLACLNDQLPGPFIKWFEKSIGIPGIVTLAQKMGDDRARAVSILGYINNAGEVSFFEGELDGKIVPARGDKDFGWGSVFEPQGQSKTFGEMERSEKHALSMRGIAAKKLKEFLAG